MTHRAAPARGFTLIELMVTLVLVVALATVAVPSFIAFQRNSELTSISNSLLASINAARSEAMKRNQHALVTPVSGSNWAGGWRVYVSQRYGSDATTYNESGSTPDLLIQQQAALPSYISVSTSDSAGTSMGQIRFDGSGYSKNAAGGAFQAMTLRVRRTDVPSGQQDAETRIVVVSTSGRVRVCKPSTDTSCTTTTTQ